MIKNRFPKFKKGNVLTVELLEQLRDYPIDTFNTFFSNYSDGIITGFDLSISEDEKLEIDNGILKFKSKLFIKKEKTVLSLPNEDGYYYINIIITNSDEYQFNITSMSIDFSKNEAKENEFELGRIKYIGGFIHCKNLSFEDFIKYDSNHIEVINVKYSDIKNYKISNEILYYFGKELLKKKMIEYNPLDLNIALLAINGTLSSLLLVEYINRKLNKNKNNYSNEDIYKNLKKILDNFKPLRYHLEKEIDNNNIFEKDGNTIFVD